MTYRPRHGRWRHTRIRSPSWIARIALSGLQQAVLAAGAGLILYSVVPAAFGWTTTVVTSGSMTPAVRVGDVVVSSPVDRPAIRRLPRGTVILVRNPTDPDKMLLHRLVEYRTDGSLITKGDANQVADSSPVPADYVRGRARIRIPLMGLPFVWVMQRKYVPLGALCVVIAITLYWRPHHPPPAQGLPPS